ncbi:putative uridylyltransferase [Limihaloglobus sulfuriphilus]|uniref:Putative uridylyltransferase n=1 Tax=Limihaloglobus sulfuriphilus TaxID=1851148 RepID=A0A1R7T5Z2_9BACT|nr:UDPGP type 1 family protein [Limihaloglobus sulfuriphilus]AQQ72026.1 putative uridylyltransferase [Limihaloglobus sulfuriphilus]
MLNFEQIQEKLSSINQQHLLKYWDELPQAGQQSFLAELSELDFESIPDWIQNYVTDNKQGQIPSDLKPAPYYPANPREADQARTLGRRLISEGKVGAFVVAGGQGTRLGYDGPKGCYPVSPIRKKPLFQIFAENILAARRRYNAVIPWYIMTSPLNNDATVKFFEDNGWFGLGEETVFIFMQGTMPNFDFDGKILLADKGSLAKSPDGHGGSLKALHRSGASAHMAKFGVEYISYFQVDNPLIKIIDPLFIGLHALSNAEMSSKALKKREPLEKVGNFCLVDGRVTVIEYSDLPEDEAAAVNPDGSLRFELGSIAIHIINRSFVERLCQGGSFRLPLHRAVKKIPCLNENGELAEPAEENGVKLETFVFDALPLARRSIILETLREEEFAPVKNAQGKDSPEVTAKMLSERAARWISSAGVEVPECTIDMSPLFAAMPEEIDTAKLPDFKPGGEYVLE